MGEYGAQIRLICLEAETLANNRISMSLISHSHCLATIAFIVNIYLWWHVFWRFSHNYVER